MKMPNQPITVDRYNTKRFVANEVITWLYTQGLIDMNKIALAQNISDEHRAQFAQLLGYSVSGWGDLSYVSDEKYESVDVS